jgi:hypothetical protein
MSCYMLRHWIDRSLEAKKMVTGRLACFSGWKQPEVAIHWSSFEWVITSQWKAFWTQSLIIVMYDDRERFWQQTPATQRRPRPLRVTPNHSDASRTPKPVQSLGVKVYKYVDGTGGPGLANGDCSLESFSFQSQTNWWGGCWRGIPFLFAARTEHTEVPSRLWSWSWGCRIGERFRQRTISVGFATSLTWKACRQSNPSRAFEVLQALCLVLSRTRVCTYIFPWVQTTIRDICPDVNAVVKQLFNFLTVWRIYYRGFGRKNACSIVTLR